MKKATILLFTAIAVIPFSKVLAKATDQELIKLSEPYELANIILALTEYGKTDPWEVAQNSDYYKEVREYFNRFAVHPLLAKVNYSREKWDYYLSFRTDAYAFVFNGDDQLVRSTSFSANEGLNPFEENLELINDFVRQTGFRTFYQNHLTYYQKLAADYLRSQYYQEMITFLNKEFGETGRLADYAIVMSPLVGRMNCHREVSGVATDFITVPYFLLSGMASGKITNQEIAIGTHMLFTELDHGFVNPVTSKYRRLLKDNFVIQKWDAGSGYETDSLATFNEYMTWAVYDIFIRNIFPAEAEEASKQWALQNETRGFYASSLFNKELLDLYDHHKKKRTVKSLYPEFIKRMDQLQKSITRPGIAYCNLSDQTIADTLASFEIRFSEPMIQSTSLDIIRMVKKNDKTQLEKIVLTKQSSNLKWSENGTVLAFEATLAKGEQNQIVFNYAWKVETVLKSLKGVSLAPFTSVKVNIK